MTRQRTGNEGAAHLPETKDPSSLIGRRVDPGGCDERRAEWADKRAHALRRNDFRVRESRPNKGTGNARARARARRKLYVNGAAPINNASRARTRRRNRAFPRQPRFAVPDIILDGGGGAREQKEGRVIKRRARVRENVSPGARLLKATSPAIYECNRCPGFFFSPVSLVARRGLEESVRARLIDFAAASLLEERSRRVLRRLPFNFSPRCGLSSARPPARTHAGTALQMFMHLPALFCLHADALFLNARVREIGGTLLRRAGPQTRQTLLFPLSRNEVATVSCLHVTRQ